MSSRVLSAMPGVSAEPLPWDDADGSNASVGRASSTPLSPGGEYRSSTDGEAPEVVEPAPKPASGGGTIIVRSWSAWPCCGRPCPCWGASGDHGSGVDGGVGACHGSAGGSCRRSGPVATGTSVPGDQCSVAWSSIGGRCCCSGSGEPAAGPGTITVRSPEESCGASCCSAGAAGSGGGKAPGPPNCCCPYCCCSWGAPCIGCCGYAGCCGGCWPYCCGSYCCCSYWGGCP